MGGGRDKSGVTLYYRRNGRYYRRDGKATRSQLKNMTIPQLANEMIRIGHDDNLSDENKNEKQRYIFKELQRRSGMKLEYKSDGFSNAGNFQKMAIEASKRLSNQELVAEIKKEMIDIRNMDNAVTYLTDSLLRRANLFGRARNRTEYIQDVVKAVRKIGMKVSDLGLYAGVLGLPDEWSEQDMDSFIEEVLGAKYPWND